MDIGGLIIRFLTSRISPMVYIMMYISVIIGFFFMTGIGMHVAELPMWVSGVVIDRQLWGTLLFITALIAELGFTLRSKTLIEIGGVGGFSLWAFASIAMAMAGQWYIFLTIALFHLVFHGYVVLASALDVLQRETYDPV